MAAKQPPKNVKVLAILRLPNQNDFNSIELRASSISFKIDNCSYLNLQNKIVSILNESNVTVEDLDNLIQFLTDSKKTATLKF